MRREGGSLAMLNARDQYRTLEQSVVRLRAENARREPGPIEPGENSS